MNSKNKISKVVIIFSKWSRKNYAIFSSLKKVVNIARLTVDICNISIRELKKAVFQQFSELGNKCVFEDKEEIEEYNFELLTIKSIVIDPKSPKNLFDLNFQNFNYKSVS